MAGEPPLAAVRRSLYSFERRTYVKDLELELDKYLDCATGTNPLGSPIGIDDLLS